MNTALRPMIVLLLWLVVGLLNTGQTYLVMAANGEAGEFQLGRMLSYNLAVWTFWAPVTWLMILLTERFPLGGTGAGRRQPQSRWTVLAVYVVVGLAILVVSGIYQAAVAKWIFSEPVPFGDFVRIFLTRAVQFNLFIYLAILAAVAAWKYSVRLRERDRVASELRAELAQAQLTALRMQLQPHFLFNTLQNVASLVRRDPESAARTVTRLGDLLRHTLDEASAAEMTLEEELKILALYLEIEQTRFPDRLRVSIDVPADLLHARVPSLVLQPLVENAVRHAVAPRAGGGSVTIRASKSGDDLSLMVSDDGPGLAGDGAGAPKGRGIGLRNTRERLKKMYGGDTLELREPPGGGLEVEIRLPLVIGK